MSFTSLQWYDKVKVSKIKCQNFWIISKAHVDPSFEADYQSLHSQGFSEKLILKLNQHKHTQTVLLNVHQWNPTPILKKITSKTQKKTKKREVKQNL